MCREIVVHSLANCWMLIITYGLDICDLKCLIAKIFTLLARERHKYLFPSFVF